MTKEQEKDAWYLSFGAAIGLALATWFYSDFSTVTAAEERPANESSNAVKPIGVIDGFEVYIVKGDPEAKDEPAYALTLALVGKPECNMVWVLFSEEDPYWQLLLPLGCKELTEPAGFYLGVFKKAHKQFFKPGFDV